jgi:hypothetical protein
MRSEEKKPLTAFLMLTLVAVWILVAGANRAPVTVTEPGASASPVLAALSPDFLLGDLIDARTVAQNKAAKRASARHRPRYVLPFPSGAQQRSSPVTATTSRPRTDKARTRTRTTTSTRTTTPSTTRPSAPVARTGPGRSAHAHHQAPPGKAKGHTKGHAKDHAKAHARAGKHPGRGHR